MNIEQLLAFAVPFTVILGPLFAMLFNIGNRLTKIEQRLDGDMRRNDEILARHDKAIHDIRNSLHAISLQIASQHKHGGHEE
jgi:hypothetical protein